MRLKKTGPVQWGAGRGAMRWHLAIGWLSLPALGLAGGCQHGQEAAADDQEQQALAALMADGELPASMAAAATGAPVRTRPPRSCDPFGAGGTGGQFDGGFGGFGGFGGTGGRTLDGGMNSSGGFIGSVDAGGPGAGGSRAIPGGGIGGSPMVDPGTGGKSPAADGGMTPPDGTGGSGFPGGTGGRGFPGGGGGCERTPIGFWSFDDCNSSRTDLFDSSFEGHTAFRSIDVACAPGIKGQAVSLSGAEDLVYVPDQPAYVFDRGVTVAGWFNPTSTRGVNSLVRKRDTLTSSFALLVNRGSYQFIIRLPGARNTDRFVGIEAPATAGVWTHVAATYDGTDLRLYLNGALAAKTTARGTIVLGTGPILMGNDILGRHFQGAVDDVWFNTEAAPADFIRELTCIRNPPTLTVTPPTSGPVALGTAVDYTVTIHDQDTPSCPADTFELFASPPSGFSVQPGFSFTPAIGGGQQISVPFTVTSSDDADPGTFTIPVSAFGLSSGGFAFGQMVYEAVASGCRVSTGQELFVKDVSVVDDPVRTSFDGAAGDARVGAWSFGRLIERLAPTADAAPDMVEALFRTFTVEQTVNTFTIAPRFGMQPTVLDPWPRSADGRLDLARAPLRLLAIVNRMDLRDLSKGNAGEGRFVFGVLDAFGNPMQFTVILEYTLAAASLDDVQAWADRWHALAAAPLRSEAYNVALQAVTDRFTGRGAVPGRPNGSGLLRLRTNEIAIGFGFPWQLRELEISAATGLFAPTTVKLTPDGSFNFTDTLGRFVTANEPAILLESHTVPETFEGQPFATGAIFNELVPWFTAGPVNPEARHHFSLNTCNGCHGPEAGVGFLQVNPRFQGQESFLSGFLTGTTVFDPVTGQQRTFNDLARRRTDLKGMVCPATTTAAAARPTPDGARSTTSLAKGINRVH
jgi:hypothetical protein